MVDVQQLHVLIPAARLRHRVRQLGRRLTRDLAGTPVLVVPLLDGCFCFAADLVRAIQLNDLRLHFSRASSYGDGQVSGGTVRLADLPEVAGATVLVVDDILDTGRTLAAVCGRLRAAGAARVLTCVLLDKPSRRVADIRADHVGFTIGDEFVVGYGLDYAGRFRHLPDLCVLRGSALAADAAAT